MAQATSDDAMVALWLGNYRSPHTRRAYAGDVATFRAHAGKPLRAVTLGDVQAFAAGLDHLAAATRCRCLSAVKSLVAMAHRLGYLPFDVAAPLQLPAVKDTLAERILSEWDVQQLLGLERHPRNGALLRLIYSAGLRISEVCGLRWRDFAERGDSGGAAQGSAGGVAQGSQGASPGNGNGGDSRGNGSGGQVTVFGKGGKTRMILLPQAIWARVTALRGEAGPNDPVFRSRNGGAVGPGRVHLIVKAAAKRARLPAAVSAHYLRHSHASHALDRGAPVHVVQTTLGHASLSTTTRYSHARPGDSSSRYLVA